MFEQSFVEGPRRLATRRHSFLVSLLLQIAVAGALLARPYLMGGHVVLPVLNPAPPPMFMPLVTSAHTAPARPTRVSGPALHVLPANELQAPPRVPSMISHYTPTPPARPPGSGFIDGVDLGAPSSGGALWGAPNGTLVLSPPPSLLKPPARQRVGGAVQAAKCLSCPAPEYPPIARLAGVQGTVRLHAIIARNGTINQLTVVSGHPLLIHSAISAVQNWRYAPTLLNGQPVEVDTVIDVNFTLSP
jgi:protein TonB